MGWAKQVLKKVKPSSNSSGPQRGSQRSTLPKGPITNKQSGVTPEVSVIDQLDLNSSSINNKRKAGFAVVYVVPSGNMIPATGSILLLGINLLR